MRRLLGGLTLAAVVATGCAAEAPAASTVTATVTTTVTEAAGDEPPQVETVATTVTEVVTTTATVAPEGPPAATGGRAEPVPVGTAAPVGDWIVSLEATNTDATAAIAEENSFNDPPAEGRRFVMVMVHTEYVGTTSARPSFDLQFKFVGAGGNTFGSGSADYCGVIPSSLSDVGDMFTGATGAGNVCASVDAAQIEGGVWQVEAFLDDKDAFFAIS